MYNLFIDIGFKNVWGKAWLNISKVLGFSLGQNMFLFILLYNFYKSNSDNQQVILIQT